MELRFIRDTDKREVDFVVLRDGYAEFAVECKTGERGTSPACQVLQRTNRYSAILPGTSGHEGFWQCNRQHARVAIFYFLP